MILLDLSQIAISTVLADLKGTTNVEVSVPLVRHMILNSIRAYKHKFGRDYGEIVIACDSRHYWRKDTFPHYKAHRKEDRSSSGLDWDAIYAAINTVKQELVDHFPYPVVEVHGAEADDVIGTLAAWTADNELEQNGLEYGPQNVLILSGDHDFKQLQKYTHIRQFAPIQKKWVTLDAPHSQVLMEHVLRGDSGDGIPNFLSVDDSFVSKIRQKSIFEKDMVNWRTTTFEDWKGTPHEKNIERNRKLIDFTLIPDDIQTKIVDRYLSDRIGRDRTKLLTFFMANKMNLMIDHLGEF